MTLNSFSCCIITWLYMIHHALSREKIDEDHSKLYPYCGRLFGHDSSNAKNRVVNSEDAQETYPWVVFVALKSKNKHNKYQFGHCGGTVIAYKYVHFHYLNVRNCISCIIPSYEFSFYYFLNYQFLK